ncbi:MAG: FMN-binding protein [bacterium]
MSTGSSVIVPGPTREPGSLKLVATLVVAGVLSGAGLVATYDATLPIVQANQARALREAVFLVVPGSTKLEPFAWQGDRLVAAAEPGTNASGAPPAEVFAARDDAGTLLGYAIPADGAGFQDTIRLLVGYEPAGRRIVGVKVLESRETPGLGDKIAKDAQFAANFEALAIDPEVVLVKRGEKTAPNQVDAITGATISSRAVVKILDAVARTWASRLESAS